MENNLLNTARQIVEDGFGKNDLSVIDNNIANDFIEHQFGMQGGKEGLKKAIQSLHVAFPDMHYRVVNHCVNDNIVWIHFQCMGTHTGAFMNNPPTGKSFIIDVIDVMRFANEKMVEHWGSPDRFALPVQLGFWPPKR